MILLKRYIPPDDYWVDIGTDWWIVYHYGWWTRWLVWIEGWMGMGTCVRNVVGCNETYVWSCGLWWSVKHDRMNKGHDDDMNVVLNDDLVIVTHLEGDRVGWRTCSWCRGSCGNDWMGWTVEMDPNPETISLRVPSPFVFAAVSRALAWLRQEIHLFIFYISFPH